MVAMKIIKFLPQKFSCTVCNGMKWASHLFQKCTVHNDCWFYFLYQVAFLGFGIAVDTKALVDECE